MRRIQWFQSAVLLGCIAWHIGSAAAVEHQIGGVIKNAEGNPIPGVLVALGPLPTLFARDEFRYEQTDQNGAFALPVTYPGKATLSCWHPDYISVTQPATTDTASNLTLLRGQTLEGTVDWGPELRGSAIVSAYLPDSGYQEYTRTDSGGTYRFANLPAGTFELEVRAENAGRTKQLTARAQASVIAGKQNRADFPAPGADGSLEGLVRDTTGFPAMALLSLRVEADGVTAVDSIRCGSDGEFHFEGLPAGRGHLTIAATGKASQLLEIEIDGASHVPSPVTLDEGLPLRCSFLNTPEDARGIQVAVYFGKLPQPSGALSEVRALLDAPAAWSGVIRSKSDRMDILAPGAYTLMAYPLASTTRDYSISERAELLRFAPVHLDTFTVATNSTGATVAAAFPGDGRAAQAAAQQPLHPIIGRWAYEYRGSIWTRTFTQDGRCILAEGPLRGWTNRYIILGEQRVAVLIDGTRRIHTLRADGKLDVEGQFIATKVE